MHWIIERHAVLGSTMDAADERARRGAPAGVVVVAGEQTQGRGQRGRRWLAPAGTSLLMTVIARPYCRPDEVTQFPELAGRYVAQAITRLTGLVCDVKLPNDVLVGERKIAGVLCQSSIEGQQVRYLLIGIGINVNINRSDLPLPTATSLEIETGRTWNLNELLDSLLDEFEQCRCFEACLSA
jgi:BirA family transcriptional regulator, biotin operon repressor / biotin---[acetyl-CoA-carboxylase] ligase